MIGGAEASHGRGRRREESALTKEAASPVRLLEVFGLKVHLRIAERIVRAVDDVDLFVNRGECVGIVGESGSGKNACARDSPALAQCRAR
jgi:ABC-type glutathione transport system ATPase component